jgi:hypothetical protein
MAKVGLMICAVLLGLVALILQILYSYITNLSALNKGFGRGRDTMDWLLRGMGGASLYNLVTPPTNKDDSLAATLREAAGLSNLPQQYCPHCYEMRPVYEGHCTTCGTRIIDELIGEARRDEALEQAEHQETLR